MYQTDVIHRKALAVLESQRGVDKPFFLWGMYDGYSHHWATHQANKSFKLYTVAPTAPHGQFYVRKDDDGKTTVVKTEPPEPAARHSHMFKDVKGWYRE